MIDDALSVHMYMYVIFHAEPAVARELSADGVERLAMLIPIPLPICNVFLLKGERPVLIDTGRPYDFVNIVLALDEHGVDLADLSLILHTHGHWDHAGCTAK